MARKIVLTEKTAPLIVYRLQQFIQRHEYIASQNHYNKRPLCSQKYPLFSPFHQIERSRVSTRGGKSRVYTDSYKILSDEVVKQLCISWDEFDGSMAYHYGDTFEFSSTQVKVRTKSPALFTNEKCTEIIFAGNAKDYRMALSEQNYWRRAVQQEMKEMMREMEDDIFDMD